MSMRSGTKIRTFKPVVYKPSENAVVVSDKPNDKKFMFLSEETKPDYRPINRRSEIKPSPQIDHRPLGADSYNKSVQVIFEIWFQTFITIITEKNYRISFDIILIVSKYPILYGPSTT